MAKKEKPDILRGLSLAGEVGYTIAIPLVIFIAGGIFLDKQFNTKPILTLGGLGLGMIISFYSLYKFLKPFLSAKNS